MKIAFDFDETLDNQYIQNIAKELINENHDVWIVTSRYDHNQFLQYSNVDVFDLAFKLNIPKEKIVFTNGSPKWTFFKDKDFDIHVDNDIHEVNDIFEHTKMSAICCEYNDWTRIFGNYVLAKKLYSKKC